MVRKVIGGYVVRENDIESLPESEPSLVFTKREAMSLLAGIKEEWLEEGRTVHGQCANLEIAATPTAACWQGGSTRVAVADYWPCEELLKLGWGKEVEAREAGQEAADQ